MAHGFPDGLRFMAHRPLAAFDLIALIFDTSPDGSVPFVF
jgi:hypothetical protein